MNLSSPVPKGFLYKSVFYCANFDFKSANSSGESMDASLPNHDPASVGSFFSNWAGGPEKMSVSNMYAQRSSGKTHHFQLIIHDSKPKLHHTLLRLQ